MSPAYTYNQITQGNCVGTQITNTLDLLKTKGVCDWESFPYSDTDCSLQPNEEQNQLALQNKISDYKGLSGENMVEEMKTLIFEQTPIIIGAYLSHEFGKLDEFGLSAYREHTVDYSLDRCHAMLVVGYSDTYNAFKVVNSWGEQWGNSGYVWIDYKAFDNVTDETAEFRVINQAYIAYDLE
jgi:cathepsin K